MERRLSALLVDDERLARAELRRLLAAHPDVEVVGEAEDVPGAAGALRARRPDVVFLDIHLADASGFELLDEELGETAVVFVTALEAHAVRAFEVNALDYLLKPVSPARLARTLERLRSALAGQLPSGERRLTLDDRVLVQEGARTELVRVSDVRCIRAEDDYSRLVLADGREHLVHESLKSWEARLPPRHFVRVHRSTVVNLDHVERLEREENDTWRLHVRGLTAPLMMSRRYAVRVKELLA
jgi:two-component system LytT family response regulator